MKLSRVAIVLFAAMVLSAKADESNVTLTIDGVIYSNVVWRSATADSVSILHKTGVASIPLEKLPPDLQKRFDYDPQKAAAYRASQQVAQAARQEALRKAREEEEADRQWQAQLDEAKQEQAERDSAQKTAKATAQKQAKDAAAKKRESDFLASLGPVTMIKFSHVHSIHIRPDGKYSTHLAYHDDQGYERFYYCEFSEAGLGFIRSALRARYSGIRNGFVVYGRPFTTETVKLTHTSSQIDSYWLIGMRLVYANGDNFPSW